MRPRWAHVARAASRARAAGCVAGSGVAGLGEKVFHDPQKARELFTDQVPDDLVVDRI